MEKFSVYPDWIAGSGKRREHGMGTRGVAWTLVMTGAVATVITWITSSDITVRFTATMAYGLGLVILTMATAIIVTTRRQAPRAVR